MYGQRRPSEVAAQLKVEYSPNSPAMRLTIVNYVLQHGIPTKYEGTVSEFLAELMGFVAESYEAFTAELDETLVDDEKGEDRPKPNQIIEVDDGFSPYL
jgi:hypothetical protein